MAPSFDAQENSWLRAAKRKFEQRDLHDETLDQRKDLFLVDLMSIPDPAVQKLIDKIDEMPTDDFWALYKTL
jgi:hypothetical protein